MNVTPTIVLWIYVILLMAGGLAGYLKAGSKVSLITSSIFAVALSLCALGLLGPSYVADILLGILVVVFGIRFAKKKQFMPGGMLLAMTVVVLALHILL
ncbi:MAG: TMEM14 family protein [Verrucomicrobia bacterium]|nr:TMEM14 family protein [Verrucomicrobiota bacterium]